MIVFFCLTRKSATSFFNPNWHEAGRIYPPYIFWIGFCQLNFHQKPGVYSILSVDAMPLSLKNLLLNYSFQAPNFDYMIRTNGEHHFSAFVITHVTYAVFHVVKSGH